MKKIFLFAFCAISLSTLSQDLPTADAVIEKYLNAIGGKEAIAKIQDLTISTTTETPRGTSETEVKYKFPDKYATSTFSNGMEIMGAVYDGNKFKMSGFRGPMGGGGQQQPPIEGKDAQIQMAKSHIFAELYYDKVGITKSVVAKEKNGDADVYKVELTSPDGKKWHEFYEVESGLKVKSSVITERQGRTFESVVMYSDYKKFKGMDVMIASKNKRSIPQMGELVTEVQSVKVNKGLKDSDFVVKVD